MNLENSARDSNISSCGRRRPIIELDKYLNVPCRRKLIMTEVRIATTSHRESMKVDPLRHCTRDIDIIDGEGVVVVIVRN